MSAARAALVAALAPNLPSDVDLIPYARGIDLPAQGTIMVRLDSIAPAGALLEYGFELLAIAAGSLPGPADDEVEDLAADLIYALELTPGVTWSKATRSIYAKSADDLGGVPCFLVPVVITIERS